jgi:hypothetical protein
MSQIPLTSETRVTALRQFGYTEREAGFLCLAALNAGYFLRRQYDTFLGKRAGGTAATLIQKAVALGHVKASTYANSTNVYHLCTRPFYAALGQVDNRNRRERQPLTIKNRLMGLDFVLAHSGNCFLSTEQDKVEYFTSTLKVDRSRLPTKRYQSASGQASTVRYFVDKLPIFLSGGVADASAPVSFCFVDEGARTVARFETYLAQYQPLLTALPRFSVVYVAAGPLLFRAAERSFARFLAGSSTDTQTGLSGDASTRLLEYFEARQLYETGQFSSFDRAKLVQLRRLREAFPGADYEARYARWKTSGAPSAPPASVRETTPSQQVRSRFTTYLLEQNYDLFGTLTSF